MFAVAVSDERECIQIEPKLKHGLGFPIVVSACVRFTVISPNLLSSSDWLMFGMILSFVARLPSMSFSTVPLFIEPFAFGGLMVLSGVQLSLPASFSPP